MTSEGRLAVREMRLDELDLRIAYFHDASDEHLRLMGVDRAKLPERAAWRTTYEEDRTRPLRERTSYLLVWTLDDAVVGFSTMDRITYGESAYMHLHILEPERRRAGMGARFVQLSAAHYLERFELQRIFSEPAALNAAPNRTLQRAGFRYLHSHDGPPGPINLPQVKTLWVLERPG